MKGTHLDDDALQSLLEGGMNAEESRKARAHIETCTVCSRALEAYRTLFDVLSDEEAMPATPAGFAASVMDAVCRERPARRARVRDLVKALAIGAAAAVVFAAVVGFELQERSLGIVSAISERAPDRVLRGLEAPAGFEIRLEETLENAGAGLTGVLDRSRDAVSLGAGTGPILLLGIILFGAIQCVAVWRLRSRPGTA